MRRVILLLACLTIFAGSTVYAQTLLTDFTVRPEPALPAMGPKGSKIVDPTFGTTILRVTDATDGPFGGSLYSSYPSVNVNSTRVMGLVSSGFDRPKFWVLDPVNFTLSGGTVPTTPPFGYATRWSGTDPDVVYHAGGTTLQRYNVATNTLTTLRDFVANIPATYQVAQVAKDLADNIFGMNINSAGVPKGYLLWRRSDNTILLNTLVSNMNETGVDKSGRYFFWQDTSCGDHIYDLNSGSAVFVADATGVNGWCHNGTGQGTVFASQQNAMNIRSLATPNTLTKLMDGYFGQTTESHHQSLNATNEAYGLVSRMCNQPGDCLVHAAFDNELLQVATSGNAVRRIAHHRSLTGPNQGGGYNDIPFANISPDGQFVAFTSNWGFSLGSNRHDLFLVKIPAAPTVVGATYYIDPTLGDDSRSSTLAKSKNTPWKHLRCMASATGNGITSPQSNAGAKEYTPVAGDIFVLKGGEIWHNADFPCTWNWSGTAGNRITVTVDPTWFTGASWTRPRFAADGVAIVGPLRPGGTFPVNAFIDLNNGNFGVHDVTFDNIETIGFRHNGNPTFNTCGQVIGSVSTNVTLDHLYIHGWVHDPYTDESGTRDLSCSVVMGSSNAPYNQGSILQNSVIDNNDGSGGGDSGRLYLWPNVLNNIITHIPNTLIQYGSGEIAGNDISFAPASFDTSKCPSGSTNLCVHPNLLETLGGTTNFTLYIHDNRIHDSLFAGTETAFLANLGAGTGNIYFWNNVLYNLAGNNMVQLDQRPQPTYGPINFFIWNNTMFPRDGKSCFEQGNPGGMPATITIQNNHCITTNLNTVDPAIVATALTKLPNTLQLPTAATAQGYTNVQTPYVFAPTDATDATVAGGPGVNLTATCSIAPLLATLCFDTKYAVTEGPNHTVVQGRTTLARPTTGAWQTGAYQFGTDLLPPAAPTNVTVQ